MTGPPVWPWSWRPRPAPAPTTIVAGSIVLYDGNEAVVQMTDSRQCLIALRDGGFMVIDIDRLTDTTLTVAVPRADGRKAFRVDDWVRIVHLSPAWRYGMSTSNGTLGREGQIRHMGKTSYSAYCSVRLVGERVDFVYHPYSLELIDLTTLLPGHRPGNIHFAQELPP